MGSRSPALSPASSPMRSRRSRSCLPAVIVVALGTSGCGHIAGSILGSIAGVRSAPVVNFRGQPRDCAEEPPRTPREQEELRASLLRQTSIVVRARATTRAELERRLGVALFHRDVAILTYDVLDRVHPCCSVLVEATVATGRPARPWKIPGRSASEMASWFRGATAAPPAGGTPAEAAAFDSLADAIAPANNGFEWVRTQWPVSLHIQSLLLAPDTPSDAPSPSTVADPAEPAELVVTTTFGLGSDAHDETCPFPVEMRLPLPPGASVSERVKAFLDAHGEIRIGEAAP
jgi:hypothetical protein